MSRKEYLGTYLTMIALRGLTDHTLKSYRTYISAYDVFYSFSIAVHESPCLLLTEVQLFRASWFVRYTEFYQSIIYQRHHIVLDSI